MIILTKTFVDLMESVTNKIVGTSIHPAKNRAKEAKK